MTYLLARVLTGMFAFSAPVVQAYVTDITSKREQPRYLALVGSMQGAAFGLGPGIGAGLSEWSLSMPMFTASSTAMFGFIIAFWSLRDPAAESRKAAAAAHNATRQVNTEADEGEGEDDEESDEGEGEDDVVSSGTGGEGDEESGGQGAVHARGRKSSITEALELAHDPLQRLIPVVLCASFAGVGSSTAFFTMYGLLLQDQFGLGSRVLGFTMSLGAIVYVTAQVAAYGRAAQRLGRHATGCLGGCLLSISIALLPVPDVPILTILLVVAHSAAFALVVPTFPALLARYAPAGSQGSILGLGQGVDALSRVILPPILGALYTNSRQAPFTLCAVMAATSGALCLLILFFNRRFHADQARREAAEAPTVAAAPTQRAGAEAEAEQREAEEEGTVALAAAAEQGAGAGEEEKAEGVKATGTEEAKQRPSVVAAATHDHETQVGHFLLCHLRRNGYTALVCDNRRSKHKLKAAIARAFPPASHEDQRAADREVRWRPAPVPRRCLTLTRRPLDSIPPSCSPLTCLGTERTRLSQLCMR